MMEIELLIILILIAIGILILEERIKSNKKRLDELDELFYKIGKSLSDKEE